MLWFFAHGIMPRAMVLAQQRGYFERPPPLKAAKLKYSMLRLMSIATENGLFRFLILLANHAGEGVGLFYMLAFLQVYTFFLEAVQDLSPKGSPS